MDASSRASAALPTAADDLDEWLLSRAGATAGSLSWSAERFATVLNADLLDLIKLRFPLLDAPLKLNLLLSLVVLRRNALRECTDWLRDMITASLSDDDDWVRVVAQLLRPLLDSGRLDFDVQHASFTDAVAYLRAHPPSVSDTGLPRHLRLMHARTLNDSTQVTEALDHVRGHSDFVALPRPVPPLKRQQQTVITPGNSRPSAAASSSSQRTPGLSSRLPLRRGPSLLGNSSNNNSNGGVGAGASSASINRRSMSMSSRPAGRKRMQVLELNEVESLRQEAAAKEEVVSTDRKRARSASDPATPGLADKRARIAVPDTAGVSAALAAPSLTAPLNTTTAAPVGQQAAALSARGGDRSLDPLAGEARAYAPATTAPADDQSGAALLQQLAFAAQRVQSSASTAPSRPPAAAARVPSAQPQAAATQPPPAQATAPAPTMTTATAAAPVAAAPPPSSSSDALLTEMLSNAMGAASTALSAASTAATSAASGTAGNAAAADAASAKPRVGPNVNAILASASAASEADKQQILAFVRGSNTLASNPRPDRGHVQKLLLRQERRWDEGKKQWVREQMLFELNYQTRAWRRLRRMQPLTDANAPRG